MKKAMLLAIICSSHLLCMEDHKEKTASIKKILIKAFWPPKKEMPKKDNQDDAITALKTLSSEIKNANTQHLHCSIQ